MSDAQNVPDQAPGSAEAPKHPRRLLRLLARAVVILIGVILLAGMGAGVWGYSRLRASLPQLEGELRLAGLSGPVEVARDAWGIPDISASNRQEAAFATGLVHAQDRFFQMDLLRRRAAGELAELFGAGALESDQEMRIHRFRQRAAQALQSSSPQVRSLLDAYAAGVNAGLSGLGAPPFEYLLLRVDPQPWKPQDTFLVLLAMFERLQDGQGYYESRISMMHDLLPGPLYDFLLPAGTEWDAPIQGMRFTTPPVPGPEVLDLRKERPWERPQQPQAASEPEARRAAGSNVWAVSGPQTEGGGALLANELHLGLTVPNIWYRLSLSWPDPQGPQGRRRVTGATLPGAPAFVVGSNGRVAWGVTNSLVDTNDVVLLEPAPDDPNSYLTPQGLRPFQRYSEVIGVKGEAPEEIEVEWTIWGPVLPGTDHQGRRRAIRWVVHEPEAVNLEILALETVEDLDQAVEAAHRSGVPALNFVAADDSGRIAWTIIGRLPQRRGCDGRLAASWADGQCSWEGLLPPEMTPLISDPAEGRVWSANNRVVGGAMLALLGDDGYFLGARAGQIRDRLASLSRPSLEDMRLLQLDDRALLMARWNSLLLDLLAPEALQGHPHRLEFRQRLEKWDGHASVDSTGYPLIREFRIRVQQEVFAALTAPCTQADEEFALGVFSHRYEGPLWKLVSQRPPHLLDPRYSGWGELLLSKVDETIDNHVTDEGAFREVTWGERNTVRMRHPMSGAIPLLGQYLDMPVEVLPGDEYMPRVQHPGYGATLRMGVSPGREEEGFFHMPGGQSGHPLSPHYSDFHNAWAAGEATPFLPGPPASILRLLPENSGGAP